MFSEPLWHVQKKWIPTPCLGHPNELSPNEQKKKDRTTYYVQVVCLTEPKCEEQVLKVPSIT